MFFSFVTKSMALSLLCISTLAASTFPRGCEGSGFVFQNNFLALNETGAQTFYLIQNSSNVTIDLERYLTSNSLINPPLQVTLDPGNWGAFSSDIQELNFKCYQHGEEGSSLVDCREVLAVCQYPRVKFALSNQGNYWIASNKSQADVIQEATHKGIYLKW